MRKLILFTDEDFNHSLAKIGINKADYTPDQLMELHEGAKNGVDISIFAEPAFDCLQMRMIRWGLEEGLDARKYAHSDMSLTQMQKEFILLERRKSNLWQFDELLMDVV